MTLQLPAARAPLDIEPGDVVRECACRQPPECHAQMPGPDTRRPGAHLVVDRAIGNHGWPLVLLAGNETWYCMGCVARVDPGELVEQEHSEWALDLARELTDHRIDALRYAMGAYARRSDPVWIGVDPAKLPSWRHLRVWPR